MKAIFFDFDGTLTYKSENIWRAIWEACGYDLGKGSVYRDLFDAYLNKQLSYQDWCDRTCDEFYRAGFNKKQLAEIADKITLIDGLEETLKALKDEGYSIHIVSGNITPVVARVLGKNLKYFDSINANGMFFNSDGVCDYIRGTNYDFEGKARFINEYKYQTKSKASDLVFVGNGSNDEWAHQSGCKTICINPDDADYFDTTKWHTVLQNVDNLTDILPILGLQSQQEQQ